MSKIVPDSSSNILRNTIISGLFITVIAFLLVLLSEEQKLIQFKKNCVNLFYWMYNGICWILNFDLKVWWVILFSFFALLGLLLLIYIMSKTVPKEPKFLSYNTGKYNGLIWKWRYVNKYGRYEIQSLNPHCPQCATQLIHKNPYLGISLFCPRCKDDKLYQYDKGSKEILETLIMDNIHKEKYKEDIDSQD